MQNSVLHIGQKLEGADELDVRLSFDAFIHFLKRRLAEEKTMRAQFFKFVIHNFENRLQGKHFIDTEEIGQYGDLLEQMYMCIFAPLADEKESAWALGVPVSPTIIYGTDPFYNKMRDPITDKIRACMVEKGGQLERKKINFELVYSVILQQLYDYSFPSGNAVIRSLEEVDTGLANFYRLNIDTRFVEVVPKGELPTFDPSFLDSHPAQKDAVAWLSEQLPLSAFRFEGIAAITVTDITTEYVVESIKELILNADLHGTTSQHEEVIRYLNILAGTNDVQFGLLPLLRVNGKPVYSADACHHSVLSEISGDRAETEETYLCLVDNYFREPRLLLYEHIPDPEPGEQFFMQTLRRGGIQSYGLVPVYHNDRLAGVLEISSRKPDCLSRALLAKTQIVTPLIAQMLRHTIDEFEARIKAIIKENFTSLQPAVEWKFNEAAWQYDRMQEEGGHSGVETIYFKSVHPLYGAVDIRNSTIERNAALRRDLEVQFKLLSEVLGALQQAAGLELVEEMLHEAQRWQAALTGALTTADELRLNVFLSETVGEFLNHFRQSRSDLAHLMEPYLKAIDETEGAAFMYRRNLEESIQLVNRTINTALEESLPGLQQQYPIYFEKFRTDGVEYDIYIGQSISPDRAFDVLYLRNLRLWQLSSMVRIARQTHQLLAEMPEALSTTQLIFVHSGPIDISFRRDERRFDVEGGYNIRYQVVKKRIDKVRVRDTNERLTQPGTVAIIYFSDREREEYEGYIRYLQEKGMLGLEVEHLDLEELQGVSGLQALRVSVSW